MQSRYAVLLSLFILPLIIQLNHNNNVDASASSSSVVRGRHFEIVDNGNNSFTYRTGIPVYINNLDNTAWVPYTVTNYGPNILLVRTGLVGALVMEDRIELLEPLTNSNRATETFAFNINATLTNKFVSQTVSQSSNSVRVTNVYDLQSGISTVCRISIAYIFPVGGGLQRQMTDSGTCPSVAKSVEFVLKLSSPVSVSIDQGNNFVQATDNGQLWLFENTEPNKAELASLSSLGSDIHINYNLGSGSINFLQQDTFTSSNPTEDGQITDTSNNDVCDTGSSKVTTGSNILVGVEDTPDTTDCYRGYFEWDITSIPDGSDVTDTVFKFDIGLPSGARNCDYNELNTQPSPASASAIFTDIGDGTSFVSNDATCTTSGDNKSLDLGTSADADVEAQLTSNWWAVGVKINDETLDASLHRTLFEPEDDAAATPKPTLEVTYTPPIAGDPVPEFEASMLVMAALIGSFAVLTRIRQQHSELFIQPE